MPKEETADVKPPRERRDSGPVTFKDGKLTMKIGAIAALASLLSMGGGYLGIKQSAPDPEVVKATAADVNEIKTELAKLSVLLSSMNNDRDNLQRQIDAQAKAIEDLRVTAANAREVEELKRRVERLEAESRK